MAEQHRDWATLPLDADRPRVVVIGGSEAAGKGASDGEHHWSSIVAAARGWDEVNLARAGTGYLTEAEPDVCGQRACPNFPAVVAEAVALGPSVVIISGGNADASLPLDEVAAAIGATIDAVRVGLPEATIIAVGPLASTPTDDLIRLDAAVKQAASAGGVKFVSLLAPNVLTGDMVSEGGTVLNDAGHAAVAARVVAAVA